MSFFRSLGRFNLDFMRSHRPVEGHPLGKFLTSRFEQPHRLQRGIFGLMRSAPAGHMSNLVGPGGNGPALRIDLRTSLNSGKSTARISYYSEPYTLSDSVASCGTEQESAVETSFPGSSGGHFEGLLMNRFCRRTPLPLDHRTWPF